MELARNAEDVLRIQRCRSGVVHAGRHIEHDETGGISLDALAQHIHNTALGDLVAHAGEELCRLLRAGFQLKFFHSVWLGVLQEAEQAHRVHSVFHVEVVAVALLVAVVLDEPLDDQGFKAGLAGVGIHLLTSIHIQCFVYPAQGISEFGFY